MSCLLSVPVTQKNKGFILYNHLFAKGEEPFTIKGLKKELYNMYGLEVEESWLRYEIEEYLNCGLVMHHFSEYIATMK